MAVSQTDSFLCQFQGRCPRLRSIWPLANNLNHKRATSKLARRVSIEFIRTPRLNPQLVSEFRQLRTLSNCHLRHDSSSHAADAAKARSPRLQPGGSHAPNCMGRGYGPSEPWTELHSSFANPVCRRFTVDDLFSTANPHAEAWGYMLNSHRERIVHPAQSITVLRLRALPESQYHRSCNQ